jgi:hypothetical protein|nr:MAG: hypothetical protein [Bacteriophage sp.]DAV33238.1 MAG TPA: hypothetical protein [Caudoviricetes sp.]
MMNGSNYSLSDIAAATGSNNRANDMWGGDGFSLIWLVLIFAIFGWGGFGGWGGGFGGNGGNGANGAGFQGWATRSDINEEFALNDIQNGIRGIQQGICDSTYSLNNTMQSGFNGMNVGMLQGFNGVQQAINADTVAGMQNTNALQSQLAQCCCDNREAIQGINYNLATNTCALQNTMNNNTRDLIENQNSNARAILDFMVNDKIATLQAENSDLKRAASQDRQSALLTTAMASQTQQLINAINPAAIPAYVVPNPNTYYGGCNGYGNGCC